MDEIMRMDKLTIGPQDILVLTLGGSYQPNVAAEFATYLSEQFGAQVVILTHGAKLEAVNASTLAQLGYFKVGVDPARPGADTTAYVATTPTTIQRRLDQLAPRESYGTQLRLAREAAKLTHRQVAERVDMDRDMFQYRAFEEDKEVPNDRINDNIERLLGVRYETRRERRYREALEGIRWYSEKEYDDTTANVLGLNSLLQLIDEKAETALRTSL